MSEKLDKIIEEAKMEEEFREILDEFENVEVKTDALWKRVLNWFKSAKNIAIVVMGVCLVACFYWIAKVESNPKLKAEIEKTVTTNVQKAKDKIINPYEVTFDLSKMTRGKMTETTSSKSGKDIFGVWYKLETPDARVTNSVYLTIYENIDSLNLNKEAFNEYVEQEAKKAEKLSK